MHFIERWLGVAPDGGDGSLERLLLALVAVVCAILVHVCFFRSEARGRPGRGAGSPLKALSQDNKACFEHESGHF